MVFSSVSTDFWAFECAIRRSANIPEKNVMKMEIRGKAFIINSRHNTHTHTNFHSRSRKKITEKPQIKYHLMCVRAAANLWFLWCRFRSSRSCSWHRKKQRQEYTWSMQLNPLKWIMSMWCAYEIKKYIKQIHFSRLNFTLFIRETWS